MAELIVGKKYDIRGVKGESYADCKFAFGLHEITAVDGQYFQTKWSNICFKNEWWDSKGFKITDL